ncbi:MAG: hypothetical protein QXE18_01085 [Thermoplasmata archaeon]
MLSNSAMMRMFVICLLVWTLIICSCSSSEVVDHDELIMIYGTVSEISGSATRNDFIITIMNGAEKWNVFFGESEGIPEPGRSVIVLARAGPDNSLVAISYDYP